MQQIFDWMREQIKAKEKTMIPVVRIEEAIYIIDKAEAKWNGGWIQTEEKLPPYSDELLLIKCSGKPKKNITFDNALCLASYTEEGWVLEMFPEWKNAEVVEWKSLDERYQPKEGQAIKEQNATEIIESVCEDICENYCKYRVTCDDNAECEPIRNGQKCPLDRLV